MLSASNKPFYSSFHSSLDKALYTAKVYREIQGYYREIRLQGFHIYRVITTIKLTIFFVSILQEFTLIFYFSVKDNIGSDNSYI